MVALARLASACSRSKTRRAADERRWRGQKQPERGNSSGFSGSGGSSPTRSSSSSVRPTAGPAEGRPEPACPGIRQDAGQGNQVLDLLATKEALSRLGRNGDAGVPGPPHSARGPFHSEPTGRYHPADTASLLSRDPGPADVRSSGGTGRRQRPPRHRAALPHSVCPWPRPPPR